jgi:hypothetical protein
MSQNSGKPPSSSSDGNGNNNTVATAGGFRLPSTTCMQHASKLAIVEDRPIMLDYWTASIEKKVIIGVKENGEKLLVKSEEEYTSPIGKIFKIESEYIILTENSIYIVSSDIQSNRIN